MSQPVERCGPRPTWAPMLLEERGLGLSSARLTSVCPPHLCLPTSPLSTLLTPICLPQSISAFLTPICPPRPCLQASVRVRPPHPSALLTHLPASVHVRPPHSCVPASAICPPQPCPLSSPVCPPAQGPSSSPWSKRLTRLRWDQPFPGGSASGRRPPWSRDRGLRGQHSLGVGGARAAQWGGLGDAASRTHTAPQAGGRPRMRVGWGEDAVASAGSSGKGSPSRTEKAPDANRARQERNLLWAATAAPLSPTKTQQGFPGVRGRAGMPTAPPHSAQRTHSVLWGDSWQVVPTPA